LYITFLSGYRVSWSHQEIYRWRWERNGIGVYFGRCRGIAFGSTRDDLGSQGARERKIAIANVFARNDVFINGATSAIAIARFLSLLDHKINSSNFTTTWRRGRSIRRSLLLLCALEIPTFAKHNTSSQSAQD